MTHNVDLDKRDSERQGERESGTVLIAQQQGPALLYIPKCNQIDKQYLKRKNKFL